MKRKAEDLYGPPDGSSGRFGPGFKPRKLCSHFQQGRCEKAFDCTFAHGLDELHPDSPEHGNGHAVQQQTPQATLRPSVPSTSRGCSKGGYKGGGKGGHGGGGGGGGGAGGGRFGAGFKPMKLCRDFSGTGFCGKGDACTFAHGQEELHPSAGGGAEVPADIEAVEDEFEKLAAELRTSDEAAQYEQPQKGGGGRFEEGFQPMKMCNYFMQHGQCQKGDSCTFAHGMEDLHPKARGAYVDNDAAAEELIQEMQLEGSSVEGPRQFPEGQKPQGLCMEWLHHPTSCTQGDSCPHAHGIAEFGVDAKASMIRCSSGRAASVTFEGAGAAAAGGGGGCGGGGGGAVVGGLRPSGGEAAGKGWGKGCGKPAGKGAPAMAALAGGQSGGFVAPPPMGSGRFGGEGFMPTRICQWWLQDPNSCTKGDQCSFAHGVHELQPRCVPTCGVSRFHNLPSRPVKMCTFFAQQSCQKGLTCTFAHDPSELANSAY